MNLTNPTGMPERTSDRYGLGCFGAPRDGGKRTHAGLDIQSDPGYPVASPIDGMIVREKRPYGDGSACDTGLLIAGTGAHSTMLVTLFYARPHEHLIGHLVTAGEEVAIATSLQTKYPGITNHVHLGIQIAGQWVDPRPMVYGDDPPDELTA